MENYIKKIGLFALLVALLLGCEKWIDPEMNINPNNPADVGMNVLLPASQAAIGYSYGGDFTRYPAMWMQHLSGVTRQSFASDRYSVLDSDINNLWNTLYGGALINLKVLEGKAIELDAHQYHGISKVLQAYTLLNITSAWGDAPFSEAFQGEDDTSPAYDTQQQNYTTVNQLLDQAIGLFGQQSPVGIAVPGRDDIIYNGDVALWTKAARSLKVRAALHLSKINGYAPVRELIDAGGLMESGADDFQFQFGSASNEWNPRYQFDNDRGDIRAGARIVNLMKETNDPRIPQYFYIVPQTVTPAGDTLPADYIGSGPGEGRTRASFLGPAYAEQNAPVFFMNYFELKFIEAEAFFETNPQRAAEAFNQAVIASLTKHGVRNPEWEALNANETAASITLERIMMAKYIAMFNSLETWTDWRRTGFPQLQLPAANVLPQPPRRFLYPLDENLYNTDNVPDHSPTSRVWWDV
jgi:hypothetical protein